MFIVSCYILEIKFLIYIEEKLSSSLEVYNYIFSFYYGDKFVATLCASYAVILSSRKNNFKYKFVSIMVTKIMVTKIINKNKKLWALW